MKAIEQAAAVFRSIGLPAAKFLKEWNGYRVYIPVGENGETLCIGYPQYCLVTQKRARMATDKEMFAIMDSFMEAD